MLTLAEMRQIAAEIEYCGWNIEVREGGNDGRPYLQVQFRAYDARAGKCESWHGRKWCLSHHMTRSEVVLTAFKAVLTASEHEVRENFRYRGRAILGPHVDVDALWEVCHTLDERKT